MTVERRLCNGAKLASSEGAAGVLWRFWKGVGRTGTVISPICTPFRMDRPLAAAELLTQCVPLDIHEQEVSFHWAPFCYSLGIHSVFLRVRQPTIPGN